MFPSSHASVPSFIPFQHFCQNDQDRLGLDSRDSSSKSNYYCSQYHGEKEQLFFIYHLRILDLYQSDSGDW